MKITLSKKEVTLLMSILADAEESRACMTCNDPYKEEEKLFTKKERIEILRSILEQDEYEEDDIKDGFMSNAQYVQYIIETIQKQI